MRLRLKAFGIARDILGGREIDFDLQGKTVGELKQEMIRRYPVLGELRAFLIAVNLEYAGDDRLIAENDEVVVIPPVSGG